MAHYVSAVLYSNFKVSKINYLFAKLFSAVTLRQIA